MVTERKIKQLRGGIIAGPWLCTRGAEDLHHVHGNLRPRGTPRHPAQHRGAKRKKQMTEGGSGERKGVGEA